MICMYDKTIKIETRGSHRGLYMLADILPHSDTGYKEVNYHQELFELGFKHGVESPHAGKVTVSRVPESR